MQPRPLLELQIYVVIRGCSGREISGDLNLLQNLILKTDVVVADHELFQPLSEDPVFQQLPCILIAAKGHPDIATRLKSRFFLHRIRRAFPDLPILALVGWNPAGLAFLYTLKFGSLGMGLGACRYVCNVKWLGLREDDLQLIPARSLDPLKPRDLRISKRLLSSECLEENYKEELALMVQGGWGAEVEALYCHGYDYLGKFIARKIEQSN